jgi:hypothetical protein
MLWMVKDFDAQTKEKAGGHTRVVLMNGHSSHYTLELLEYARDNNIVILRYPPHCTHVLQGLDVVCFAKMKEELCKEIHEFEDLHMAGVGKGDFAGVFRLAFLHAFTPDSVKAAFEATGVHPFNPGSSQRSRCDRAYQHPHGAHFLCGKRALSELFSKPWAANPQPHLTYLPQPVEDQSLALPTSQSPLLQVLSPDLDCAMRMFALSRRLPANECG